MRALAGLTALAALLRFATLDLQGFWFDESVSVTLVRMDLGGLLDSIPQSESTPPLYYLFAWAWAKLFGSGEVGLRSLSALLGTASVPVFYAAAVELCSRRAGLIVAAMAAVNPLLVWYSQEARAYALLALLGAASLYFFARLLRQPSRRALAGWALTSALALGTHYFAVFLVLPEAVWLAAVLHPRRQLLPALAAVVAAGLALLPLLLEQASLERTEFIRGTSLAYRLGRVPKQFLVGFDSPLEVALTLVAYAAAGAGVLLAVRVLRTPGARAGGLRAAAVVGGAAVALPLCLGVVGADYFDTRNLLAAWLPLLTVIAAGFAAPRRWGLAGIGLLCGVGLASVVGVALEPRFQRDDWRGAAAAMGRAPGSRAIVVSPETGRVPMRTYRAAAGPMPPAGVPLREVVLAAPVARGQDRTHPGSPPRPAPRSIPGFVLNERRLDDSYTLLRYRAPSPVPITRTVLEGFALHQGVRAAVLLEPAARARRPDAG